MIQGAVLGWAAGGCGAFDVLELPAKNAPLPGEIGLTTLARLVHISDTHVVDEESPARFPGAYVITPAAWRPYEAYAGQLLDGTIRMVNRIHAAGPPIDCLIHTGDACDNVQGNELDWLLQVMDGGPVDPRSGPDDRDPQAIPAPELDPHAPFVAQGLYRQHVHGTAPALPWYIVFGNHDVNAIGTFPIFTTILGRRMAPLPLPGRPGWWLPTWLDPTGELAHGFVTPAQPGPPALLEVQQYVAPNPTRAFFDKQEFIAALLATQSQPAGHGFSDARGPTWYSTLIAPGVRLIGLDTTDRTARIPGHLYFDGALSRAQLNFLAGELSAADARQEVVVIASHHPSRFIPPDYGVEVTGAELRAVLAAHASVVLHLAGHTHRHQVVDRGTYLEIETGSTLDAPQEGRLVELSRAADGAVVIGYETFSHLDERWPPLGDDPLRGLRQIAADLANADQPDALFAKPLADDEPNQDFLPARQSQIWLRSSRASVRAAPARSPAAASRPGLARRP